MIISLLDSKINYKLVYQTINYLNSKIKKIASILNPFPFLERTSIKFTPFPFETNENESLKFASVVLRELGIIKLEINPKNEILPQPLPFPEREGKKECRKSFPFWGKDLG